MITIQRATLGDLLAIEQLLHMAYQEASWPMPQPERPWVYHLAVDQICAGMVAVAVEREGDREHVVGVLMLRLEHWTWNRKAAIFKNAHLYIAPQARAKKTAEGHTVYDGLIRAAQSLSDTTGIPLVIESMFGGRPDAKDRLMESSGMTYLGGNFLYMPKKRHEEGDAAQQSANAA